MIKLRKAALLWQKGSSYECGRYFKGVDVFQFRKGFMRISACTCKYRMGAFQESGHKHVPIKRKAVKRSPRVGYKTSDLIAQGYNVIPFAL